MTRDHPSVGRHGPSTAPTLVLSQRQIAEIREHAREAYPHECCGVFVGQGGQRLTVRSVHRTDNIDAERARDRYEVDPREILRLDRSAETQGQEIVGFYHSHPDHPPLPSATDAEHAWPGYVYVIASVAESGAVKVRSWICRDNGNRFDECPIVLQRDASLHPAGSVHVKP